MLKRLTEEALHDRLASLDRARLTELLVQLVRERPELADWVAVQVAPQSVSNEVKNRVAAHQDLAKEARRKKFLASDVRLLLGGGELQLAENLLVARVADLDGSDFTFLTLLCDESEKAGAWLIATLVRRAMLDDILNTSRSNAYPVAARHLHALRGLASRIADYRGLPSQTEYETALHMAHDSKTSFWSWVETHSKEAF